MGRVEGRRRSGCPNAKQSREKCGLGVDVPVIWMALDEEDPKTFKGLYISRAATAVDSKL